MPAQRMMFVGVLAEGALTVFVKMFLAVVIATVLLAAAPYADAESNNGTKVLELTEGNYDEVINNTPLILVEFYAPWYVASPGIKPLIC